MASESINIILRSTESRHFYTKKKNKRNKEKLSFKKFDPVLRKHVLYTEEKIK